MALREALDRFMGHILLAALSLSVIFLASLLIEITFTGLGALSPNLIRGYPSSDPSKAGLRPAIWGSVWVVGLAMVFALPLGVATALHLSEYSANTRLSRIIYFNLTNLAAVPSVVYGLVGLSFLGYMLGAGRSVLTGAVTLSFLILPLIVVASMEAIRAVPELHRLGAYALGATKTQVIARIVLPEALPGILTGAILAVSRAMGEAAPLLVISGLIFVREAPSSLFDEFTVLPLQIFSWILRPQDEFRMLSAASIIVLLVLLLSMNSLAIVLRNMLQERRVE